MDAQDIARPAPWSQRSAELGGQAVDRAQGIEVLARTWQAERFIAALKPDELWRLGEYLHFLRVGAERELIRQNEHGDFMVVVLEGRVAVSREQPVGGPRVRLAEVHAGDVVGDMAMLDSGARSSYCTTLTPCLLAVVDAPMLEGLIEREPRIGVAVMAALSRRLSLRLRQVSTRLSVLLAGR